MIFRLVGADSAGELARRLLVSAVKLTLTADEVQSALAHTVEGITTPLVRQEAPERTGGLRRGLHGRVERSGDGMTVRIISDEPYGQFVQYGTGIYHVPDPHEAWGGHEGQHPNDYVGRGMKQAETPVRAALVAAGERIWVRFSGDLVS